MSAKHDVKAGRTWRPAPVLIAVALLGLVTWVAVHASGGTPRLAVDTTAIDLGHVPYDTYVDPVFTITNTGSAPLNVAAQPEVEVVQGC